MTPVGLSPTDFIDGSGGALTEASAEAAGRVGINGSIGQTNDDEGRGATFGSIGRIGIGGSGRACWHRQKRQGQGGGIDRLRNRNPQRSPNQEPF